MFDRAVYIYIYSDILHERKEKKRKRLKQSELVRISGHSTSATKLIWSVGAQIEITIRAQLRL